MAMSSVWFFGPLETSSFYNTQNNDYFPAAGEISDTEQLLQTP